MDLPAELRLLIAEYALPADQPLVWHWINWTKINRTGTIMTIEQHTGLV
jgi:hypothetical protein